METIKSISNNFKIISDESSELLMTKFDGFNPSNFSIVNPELKFFIRFESIFSAPCKMKKLNNLTVAIVGDAPRYSKELEKVLLTSIINYDTAKERDDAFDNISENTYYAMTEDIFHTVNYGNLIHSEVDIFSKDEI